MTESVEIRNETNRTIFATVCRSKLSGQLYVHIGKVGHGKTVKVKPSDYAIAEVNEVEF